MEKQYDLIVIGAGPGGYPAALKAAGLGKQVAILDNREPGGTCLNRGCIPTKTLLHVSQLYREQMHSELFGLHHTEVTFNLAELWQHKNSVLHVLRAGILQQFKKRKVTWCQGTGRITAPGIVEVTEADGQVSQWHGGNILIAAGSSPVRLPIPGIDLPGVFNSDRILAEDCLGPDSHTRYQEIVIIGGGVIGMEMAAVYSDLGSQVTVLEAADRILPGMDKEISQNLKMIMKKRGVRIHTSVFLKEICQNGDGLVCRFEEKGELLETRTDGVLVSVGRKPDTEELLDLALRDRLLTERGYIKVDESYQTEAAGIYAVGDVIGGISLAHMATAEGIRAVETMYGLPGSQNLSVIPACVYTSPEIASVGMTADEAKAAGIEVKTGKYIMSVNGKSVLTGQERGFIKLVAEAASGRIIGAQLMCARATDMIGELSLAIVKQLTAKDLSSIVMAHPTFGEGIAEAAEDLK